VHTPEGPVDVPQMKSIGADPGIFRRDKIRVSRGLRPPAAGQKMLHYCKQFNRLWLTYSVV